MLENLEMANGVQEDVVRALEPATLPPTNGISKAALTQNITNEQNGTTTGSNASEDGEKLRRHPSGIASLEELNLGPSVVVPPEQMHQPGDAHETATAMERAKRRLVEKLASQDGRASTPTTPATTSTTDQFAFAFDIDGVLIRGGKVIPQAIEAMKILNGQNEYGIKV